MITTNYLTDLVTKYFSTVFFLWVIGNILLRLLVTKKRIKKKKKRKRRGGGIGDVFYVIWCALRWLLTFGQYGCSTEDYAGPTDAYLRWKESTRRTLEEFSEGSRRAHFSTV